MRLELDDEKKKVEDLQFKIEEDEVMRDGDNDENTEELQQKIKTLEEKLKKSEVNFTVNQTELNSKIKNLECDLEKERNITSNQKSIVDQFQSLTLEFEATRKSKDDITEELSNTKTSLGMKIKELEQIKDENSNKLFEAEEQITLLNVNMETAQKEIVEAKEAFEKEKLKFNEYLETQHKEHEFDLDQIHGLEKQLSAKGDQILELQHKYETLQKTETKQNTIIEERQEELKAKVNENQDLKSAYSKLELEQKSLNEAMQRLTNQSEELNNVKIDLEQQLKSAKLECAQVDKNYQGKVKEVEELKMQSEKSGSETQKALQKKTEELIQNSTKLTEANDLIGSFKDVQKANEEQMQLLKEEIEQGKVAYKKVNSVKEGLEKEIRTLREASKNSTDEVKRLSGSISTKDIELDSLRSDLTSLSTQLNQLKEVIDQQESEAQDKENQLLR